MTIQARKRATNKKRGSSRAKAHDRRLLAKAKAEQAEGMTPANRTMLAGELREVASNLQMALGEIIEAHTEEDTTAFGLALKRVNSARVVLEGEASKLEVQP
ncbi:MAG TPA: hypothetical protein VJN18_14785 [Polyangiaceae bacterium]|nr:hypothetical protein [Polyangiaceae bacterium]